MSEKQNITKLAARYCIPAAGFAGLFINLLRITAGAQSVDAQGAGRNGRPLLLAHATWIEAEIPQALPMHPGQSRGIGADSPVRGVYAANAPKIRRIRIPVRLSCW
jgi:hypothetical protein